MISTDTSANVIHDAARPQEDVAAARRDPRSAALVCLAIYLAVSGLVLGAGGHLVLAALHIAGAEAARRLIVPSSGASRMIGDLLPLVVAPLLYGEIPLLISALGTTYHDATVQGWELALFGTQPARTLAGALPFTPLSELLHAGYLAYYGVIFIPPLALLARGDRRGFAETVFALTLAYVVCWTLFALFPVEGPRFEWPSPVGVPDGPVRRVTLWVLANGSARGAAFPSSHMAVSVVQTLMAWRRQRRVALVLLPVAILVGTGAVYGGFHYAVDILAGTALGVVVVWTAAAVTSSRKTVARAE